VFSEQCSHFDFRHNKAEAKKRCEAARDSIDKGKFIGEAIIADLSDIPSGTDADLDNYYKVIKRNDILLLDEPTTGLDLRSRLIMWDIIKQLVSSGTTRQNYCY
jgi:ABC-type Na+ transport system ATPase subunit NatA